MPTTRHQTAVAEGRIPSKGNQNHDVKPKSTSQKHKNGGTRKPKGDESKSKEHREDIKPKGKHVREDATVKDEEPSAKKIKTHDEKSTATHGVYKTGTIERGHIYFFYRPRVQLEEAHSVDDVKNFHILFVPRPPAFSQTEGNTSNETHKKDPEKEEEIEMKVLEAGADAIPAAAVSHQDKKFYRLVTVGKKKLPDVKSGTGRHEQFWGTVTAVGDDLNALEAGLEAKSYETKTYGTRHEEPARLVARGGYAIVNADAPTPSKRETHLGYHISHPNPKELSDVQHELGIHPASSFVVQVKNPLAPATGQQVHAKPAEYPKWIMHSVFGAYGESEGRSKGRESYGLRFASCETPELLNYKNVQILLIAARDGEEGLEHSLGEGRGTALTDTEANEEAKPVNKVFEELGLDLNKFPAEPLKGNWI